MTVREEVGNSILILAGHSCHIIYSKKYLLARCPIPTGFSVRPNLYFTIIVSSSGNIVLEAYIPRKEILLLFVSRLTLENEP